ncbi:hypothetical protein ElyMa_000616600 [Elysia marginata]|uniref:Uncharacterized protein n=1 Tax=Elysia marginata TaxID=1093978 RepID=A0AAV4GBN4_9GAST|nr:hypothetical protein ElyMa_000616600 [Elysia marginata]
MEAASLDSPRLEQAFYLTMYQSRLAVCFPHPYANPLISANLELAKQGSTTPQTRAVGPGAVNRASAPACLAGDGQEVEKGFKKGTVYFFMRMKKYTRCVFLHVVSKFQSTSVADDFFLPVVILLRLQQWQMLVVFYG